MAATAGLKVALRTFPEGLVTGTPPDHLIIKAPNRRNNSNSVDNILLNNNINKNNTSNSNRSSSKSNGRGSVARCTSHIEDYKHTEKPNHVDMSASNNKQQLLNNKHSHSTNSLNTNGNSNNNANNKNQLSQSDIDLLNLHLHNNNETPSRLSSRMSCASNTSMLMLLYC